MSRHQDIIVKDVAQVDTLFNPTLAYTFAKGKESRKFYPIL